MNPPTTEEPVLPDLSDNARKAYVLAVHDIGLVSTHAIGAHDRLRTDDMANEITSAGLLRVTRQIDRMVELLRRTSYNLTEIAAELKENGR